MRLRTFFHLLWTYVLAVVVAAVLGSVAQTQLNLQALINLGPQVELPMRLRSTLFDLYSFAPMWALIIAAGFLLALPVAALMRRWLGGRLDLWFALAGAVALMTALLLMHKTLGITVIAAARSLPGVLLLCAAGGFGAWLQGWLIVARNRPTEE